jgi:hypothetical protein
VYCLASKGNLAREIDKTGIYILAVVLDMIGPLAGTSSQMGFLEEVKLNNRNYTI